VGLVVVVVVLAGLLVAALRVEPLRASLWQAVGPSCGAVRLPPVGIAGPGGAHDNRGPEACFARAYARCQAASLTASQLLGIDTSSTDTFVVEPGLLGPCGLADRWESLVDAGLIRQGGTVSCTGMELESDGLHIRGCGSLGDSVLPPQG
jgi:hypothetical protein